ncbi:50S ribosomal protein L23 [Candidatus Roizmanbacteria bacterium RIFCSPLOWO2_12_FULL_40_12]|uniref:Large ribosomal subunit protein uL23 n=1 Tax=Candidatus Roizmanbacteria bacterium RIFCSPLOWO2_01_FULL_40_42 TaxID=1802066 RepID=A0A1F7J4I1_9BACT|nr:MAG: 50S ribosomal protein L23 [Candidatus Roizmanbacteria bacterium RIFCSPHIGHO2_01_FULL_40_98]OGK27274.1 MAG: 50S ribosomal protein L23 [Candidatus Roizmanbacteria bacterium RIFCSPHIGHO2_02_FULL_40_53]OGK30854.1 MAG: 50S ribosomal protein L23 [Candidatus Roizmanbacteria bacterium RIFCSPHIGHO2_12_41_18]OGK36379.1 MAG: 50S ribosomal protein L23 [Candidatus Roizmanbacteria bacterium RIFCSPHIGHO2_12_FULL_40_130]OGK50507.1 MAG: 50S ribosomal protein L23 [Candidatus Roizmanbacteria bacterium RIF
MKIEGVILGPVLTEKATNLATGKVYMFLIHKDATKFKVKDALEKLYQVKISQVSIMTRKGKERRTGRRMMKKTLPNRKIAYVKVTEGKIDLFPQV